MLGEATRREIRRLTLRTRRRVENLLAGEYLSAFKGRGIEFAEVREYEPGDDVRSIDWNVSARTGRTHVKRFIEERELTVILCVDASASGDFASTGRLKRRLACEIATTLAMSAALNNDRVGLLLFTDRVERFVPPRKGSRHVARLARDLVAFEPAGRATSWESALGFLGRVQKRPAMVFLISDFLDLPSRERSGVLARRHEAIAIRVLDPREVESPPIGLVRAIDPETGIERLVDLSRTRIAAYARARRAHDDTLSACLDRARIDRVDVRTDADLLPELIRYFRARGRRRVPA